MNPSQLQHQTLTNIWLKLSRLGIRKVTDPIEMHSLILTNQISVIAVPVIIIISLLLGFRQWNNEPAFVLFASVFFIAAPILNAYGLSQIARLLLCFAMPFIIMGVSIISKTIPGEEITNTEYFDYRYVLIATSIIPPTVFNFKRAFLLFIGALPFFISLVFFDQIHDAFGVGFYQINHEIDSYPITTWVSSLMFIIVATVLFMLRKSSDYLQIKNFELINDLKKARSKILEQNKELSKRNNLLLDKVDITNDELIKTNSELIKHNNELQQFSYTVSHNLRGPVARIIGLVELLSSSGESESKEYMSLLKRTARLLDTNIKDLGTIVDIRKDVFRVRQVVQFEDLVNDLKVSYADEIRAKDVRINTVFTARSLTTIRPMIVSIIDNLFSNALKYSSESRRPEISISSARGINKTILSVRDNGIGIDMKAYGHDLFKLYRRFNTQTEGKGIGLYLVLKQVESLGGDIKVDSKLDEFTQFEIHLPEIENQDRQEVFREDYIDIFYNANRDLLSIEWLDAVGSAEFRYSMERAYESLKELKVKSWMIDLRKRSELNDEDRSWFLNEFIPEVFKRGLKRLVVLNDQLPEDEYLLAYSNNESVLRKYGISVHFCMTTQEANEVLKTELSNSGLSESELIQNSYK